MKTIMYHYVRKNTSELPYFSHLNIDDFRAQLEWFSNLDRFLTSEEIEELVATKRVPQDGIVLTFDDGLADHYEYVLPELARFRCSGIFYVPTGMYRWRRLLNVHRVHYLLGRFGGAEMFRRLQGAVETHMLSHAHVQDFRVRTYEWQQNDEATTELKRILNYYIAYEYQTEVLDRLMAGVVNEDDLVDRYYLSSTQIADLQRAGMFIGSHSVSHPVFSKLGLEDQRREIAESFSDLEAITGGLRLRSFCYPYGGAFTFTSDTECLLRELNCAFAFDVDPREVTTRDLVERPMALPRYDCNRFPHGQIRRPCA